MSTDPTRADEGRVCAFDGCGEDCPDDSETPRQPAESSPEPPAGPERGTGEAGPETTAQAAEYRCPDCYRWAPWTDGLQASDGEDHDEFWCQTCGSQTPIEDMESRAPQLIDADLFANPHTVIHLTAEDMARAPLTIEIDHAPLLQFEPGYPPATIPNEAMPHLAGFINAIKPLHLREVAESLERLGHTAAARAVRSAAKDLEDGDA